MPSELKVQDLKEGQELTGIVVRVVEELGAFVDVGADKQGLVHLSQVSRKFIPKLAEVVRPGQTVKVWVRAVSLQGRLDLTMLDAAEPDEDVELFREVPPDAWLDGRIQGIHNGGAFVSVTGPNGEGPAEGFIHISQIQDSAAHCARAARAERRRLHRAARRARRRGCEGCEQDGFLEHPADVLQPGQNVKVRVVESEGRGLRLSMRKFSARARLHAESQDVSSLLNVSPSEWFTARVDHAAPFGVFVEMDLPEDSGQVVGLVHISEMREGRVGDPAAEAMQYEGLPFVGHRRLRNFLAHWYEQGLSLACRRSPLNLLDASPEAPSLDEDAGEINEEAIFLKDGDRSASERDKAFHILLNFVSEVSIHLNYWLDWTTPIHRRPRWAHQWARHLWRSYLALLGRRRPLAQPERAAAEFARLSEDLCRLLAFIQITSFDLLSSELGSLEARTEALRRSLAGLKWQERADRRSMRHSWLGSMGSETALSEQVAALSERRPTCMRSSEGEPSTRYPGRDQLRESDLTFQVLVESLNRYIWESGQLSHWRKWWPVYGLAFLGVLVGAWRWRLGEREVRHGLVQHSAEVWRQFLNEWILLPFQQLWEALLLPGPKDCITVGRARGSVKLASAPTGQEELRVQLRDLRAEEEALERMVTSFARFARAESTFAVKGKEGVEDAALPELYFEWSMRLGGKEELFKDLFLLSP
eukprot:g8763.t1